MKVLHTADWHLGIDLHKVSMIEDQRYFATQLKQMIEEEHIDVVIIAGDVYDTTLATKEAIDLYNDIMNMLCMELKVEVIMIAGNHDSPTRLATCADLLSPMGLHIVGKIDGVIEPIVIKDTRFVPIPYFHVDTLRRFYGEDIKNEEEAFRVICAKALEDKKENHTYVAIAHTFAAGASTCESDRFASIGGSDLVNSNVFDGFDYVALGHLHRFQKMSDVAYYSGSPIPYSFSEANQEKKVIMFDTESKKITTRELLALHPLLIKKGSFEELKALTDIDEHAYVKLEVIDSVVSYEMLEYFRERIPNLIQLSGKSFVNQEQVVQLQMNEMDKLNDVDIVKQFFFDYFHEELSEEQLALFQEAIQASEEEFYAA